MEQYNNFPNWSNGFYEKRVPKLFGITKAIRIESGDGWKDNGKKGDVAFVYAREMRAPYAAGSFMWVGNPIQVAGAARHRFERPSFRELWDIRWKIFHDVSRERRRLKLMFGPHRTFSKGIHHGT